MNSKQYTQHMGCVRKIHRKRQKSLPHFVYDTRQTKSIYKFVNTQHRTNEQTKPNYTGLLQDDKHCCCMYGIRIKVDCPPHTKIFIENLFVALQFNCKMKKYNLKNVLAFGVWFSCFGQIHRCAAHIFILPNNHSR